MSEKINASLIPDNAITEISGKIYDDVAHKTLTQIGDVSESLMKLVFLPFKCLGMTVDELEKKYKFFIEKTINKVPQNKLVAPDIIIASQILEHVKYVFTEDILVEMFSNLLASDMNIDSKNKIHPSFVDTLSKMNALDAKIILYIFYRGDLFESTLHFFTSNISDKALINETKIYNISMIIPDIEQWDISSIFLQESGIIEKNYDLITYYKKFRNKLKKHFMHNKIPKKIKKIFSLKGKTRTNKKQTLYIDLLIILGDNFINLLKPLKTENLRMDLFYEQCIGFYLTRYGIQFLMHCLSKELDKYVPEDSYNQDSFPVIDSRGYIK